MFSSKSQMFVEISGGLIESIVLGYLARQNFEGTYNSLIKEIHSDNQKKESTIQDSSLLPTLEEIFHFYYEQNSEPKRNKNDGKTYALWKQLDIVLSQLRTISLGTEKTKAFLRSRKSRNGISLEDFRDIQVKCRKSKPVFLDKDIQTDPVVDLISVYSDQNGPSNLPSFYQQQDTFNTPQKEEIADQAPNTIQPELDVINPQQNLQTPAKNRLLKSELTKEFKSPKRKAAHPKRRSNPLEMLSRETPLKLDGDTDPPVCVSPLLGREDFSHMLKAMFSNSNFQEKIADNINKVAAGDFSNEEGGTKSKENVVKKTAEELDISQIFAMLGDLNHYNDDSKKQMFFPSEDQDIDTSQQPAFELSTFLVDHNHHHQEKLLKTAKEIVDVEEKQEDSVVDPLQSCVRNLNSDLGIEKVKEKSPLSKPSTKSANKTAFVNLLDAGNRTDKSSSTSVYTENTGYQVLFETQESYHGNQEDTEEPKCLNLKTPSKVTYIDKDHVLSCQPKALPPLQDIESIAKDALLLLSNSPAKPLGTPNKETTSFSYLSLLKDCSSQAPDDSLLWPQQTAFFTSASLPSFMTSTQSSVVVQPSNTSFALTVSSTQQQQLPILQMAHPPTLSSSGELLKATTTNALHSQNELQQFFEKPHQSLSRDNLFPLILPKPVSSQPPPQVLQPVIMTVSSQPPLQVLQPVIMNSFVTAPIAKEEPSIYHQLNIKQSDTKLRQCERKRRSRQRKSKETPKVATRFLSFQPPPTINQQQLVSNNMQQMEPKVIVSDMFNSTPFFNVKVLNVQSPIKSTLKVSSASCNDNNLLTINIAEISPSSNFIQKKSVDNCRTSLPVPSPRSILKTTSSKMHVKGKRQPQLILPRKEISNVGVTFSTESSAPAVVIDKLPISSYRRVNHVKEESTKRDNFKDKANHKKLMKVKFNFKSPKKKYDEGTQAMQESPHVLKDLDNITNGVQQPDSNVNNPLELETSTSIDTHLSDIKLNVISQPTAPAAPTETHKSDQQQSNVSPVFQPSSSPSDQVKTEEKESASLKTYRHIDFSYSLIHENTVDASDRLKDIIKEFKNDEVKTQHFNDTCLPSSLPSSSLVLPLKNHPENIDTSQTSQNVSEPIKLTFPIQKTPEQHVHGITNTGHIGHLASPVCSDVTGPVVISSPYGESADSLDSSPFRGGGRKRKLSDPSDKFDSSRKRKKKRKKLKSVNVQELLSKFYDDEGRCT